MSDTIRLTLTYVEAALLWNLVDAQSDAGACEYGNTELETDTLASLTTKLHKNHSKFSREMSKLTVRGHD